MGMRRAQDMGVQLARAGDVVDIAPLAEKETNVFETANRAPDLIFGHRVLSRIFSPGVTHREPQENSSIAACRAAARLAASRQDG